MPAGADDAMEFRFRWWANVRTTVPMYQGTFLMDDVLHDEGKEGKEKPHPEPRFNEWGEICP